MEPFRRTRSRGAWGVRNGFGRVLRIIYATRGWAKAQGRKRGEAGEARTAGDVAPPLPLEEYPEARGLWVGEARREQQQVLRFRDAEVHLLAPVEALATWLCKLVLAGFEDGHANPWECIVLGVLPLAPGHALCMVLRVLCLQPLIQYLVHGQRPELIQHGDSGWGAADWAQRFYLPRLAHRLDAVPAEIVLLLTLWGWPRYWIIKEIEAYWAEELNRIVLLGRGSWRWCIRHVAQHRWNASRDAGP